MEQLVYLLFIALLVFPVAGFLEKLVKYILF